MEVCLNGSLDTLILGPGSRRDATGEGIPKFLRGEGITEGHCSVYYTLVLSTGG